MDVVPPQVVEGAVGQARVCPAGFPGEEGATGNLEEWGRSLTLTRTGQMGEVKQVCQGPWLLVPWGTLPTPPSTEALPREAPSLTLRESASLRARPGWVPETLSWAETE